MTRAEKIALLELLDERDRRKPLWVPQKHDPTRPDYTLPQYTAFTSEAEIIGFGGAAGGSKTDSGIGMSLMLHKRCIIYRKQYLQFEKIEERFKTLTGPRSLKLGATRRVVPPKERGVVADVIVLASLDHEDKDREKSQGRDYDFIFFDEVTQLKQETVEYLMQWNRSAEKGQRCQTLMAFNPPTRPEGAWVKQYFAPWLDKKNRLFGKVKSGEVLHRVAIASATENKAQWHYFDKAQTVTHHPVTGDPLPTPLKTVSITFIRAFLRDNLFLRDTDYEAKLRQNSDPRMAQTMLEGEFLDDLEDGIMAVVKPAPFRDAVMLGRETPLPKRAPDCIAIDAAMGGKDDLMVSRGWWEGDTKIFAPLLRVPGSRVDTPEKQWEWCCANVPHFLDARVYVVDVVGGAGGGIYRDLRRYVHDSTQGSGDARANAADCVVKFNGGEATTWKSLDRTIGFANAVSAAWGRFGQGLFKHRTALPDDDELERQFLSRQYKRVEPNYQIEAKEQFSERIGRSPDHADAMAMCDIGLVGYLGVVGR